MVILAYKWIMEGSVIKVGIRSRSRHERDRDPTAALKRIDRRRQADIDTARQTSRMLWSCGARIDLEIIIIETSGVAQG